MVYFYIWGHLPKAPTSQYKKGVFAYIKKSGIWCIIKGTKEVKEIKG